MTLNSNTLLLHIRFLRCAGTYISMGNRGDIGKHGGSAFNLLSVIRNHRDDECMNSASAHPEPEWCHTSPKTTLTAPPSGS